MKIALAHPAGQVRQLAPFILLSLLLHVVLLLVIRLPAKNFSVAPPHLMEVYFSSPSVAEPVRMPSKARIEKPDHPAKLLASPPSPQKSPAVPLTTQPNATPPADTPQVFNPQQLMESAKSIARDEARKTEQQIAALEKKRLNTPLGSLEQSLRQPYKEIRLANGILKIVTSTGTFCIQLAPYFARDSAGVFGIPTKCP